MTEFEFVVKQAVATFGVAGVADFVKVSRPTVKRWVDGKNMPHEGIRPGIVSSLTEKLSQRRAVDELTREAQEFGLYE